MFTIVELAAGGFIITRDGKTLCHKGNEMKWVTTTDDMRDGFSFMYTDLISVHRIVNLWKREDAKANLLRWMDTLARSTFPDRASLIADLRKAINVI